MQSQSDVDHAETVADLGLVYWTDVDHSDILRTSLDNKTSHYSVASLPILKQSLSMVVIYTLAYSAVFILGKDFNSVFIAILKLRYA